MKRFSFGLVAVLAAVVLPFSGLASAASSVDYEKSIGQVDGADTVNWVVTATDDGGYVVGGQTVSCYRRPAQVLEGATLTDSDEDWEKVSSQECLNYYNSGAATRSVDMFSKANFNVDTFCSEGSVKGTEELGDNAGLLGDGDEGGPNYVYKFSCVDYIAKFKKNGTKEWLTTIDDDSKPVAVNKLADSSYRLIVYAKRMYAFDARGVQVAKKDLEANYKTIYINSDGSITSDTPLTYSDANGAIVAKATESGIAGYYDWLFPTKDGYVANKCWYDMDAKKDMCVIVDISKDISTIKERELKDVDADRIFIVSANEKGDILAYDPSKGDNVTLISIDKDGNVIGESDILKNPQDFANAHFFKDFTIGFGDNEFSSVTRIVKFDRDLSVEYKYEGSGNEIINDVAVLKDKSLVGVGVAIKGSSSMPVIGDVNGGYLRLVAKQDSTPTPSERPVNNPKTWDAVDTIATIGGVALLGLGFFVRRNLNRR